MSDKRRLKAKQNLRDKTSRRKETAQITSHCRTNIESWLITSTGQRKGPQDSQVQGVQPNGCHYYQFQRTTHSVTQENHHHDSALHVWRNRATQHWAGSLTEQPCRLLTGTRHPALDHHQPNTDRSAGTPAEPMISHQPKHTQAAIRQAGLDHRWHNDYGSQTNLLPKADQGSHA